MSIPEETTSDAPEHAPPEGPDVAEQLIQCLSDGKTAEALDIIKDEGNKDALVSASWDLVPKLSDFLTDKTDTEHPEVLDACEATLLRLVEIGNPKELLLVLLEQMDSFNNDLKFKSLLVPVQKCLQNLPGKRGHSIAITLETIQGHVESLPIPDDQELHGKDLLLLDCDPNVQRINDVISALVKFMTPFVEEVSWRKADPETRQKSPKQIQVLSRHIVRLLDRPLAVLDLSYDVSNPKAELVKSTSRVCAEKLLHLMTELQADHFKVISQMLQENERIACEEKHRKKKAEKEADADSPPDELDKFDVDDPIPLSGMGVVAYLVWGERLECEMLPQIYTPHYLLEFCCQFVSALLIRQHSLVVMKGLTLFHSTLDGVGDGTLPANLLEWPVMKSTLEGLLLVITSCPVKEVCRYGVKILPKILQKLENAGKYKAVYMLLNVASHSGLAGYATQLLKNEIDAALKLDAPDTNFTGAKLHRLLKLVFALPAGAETDLLEQSERVMAALNLLRYLILRDKPADNVTGIWDLIPQLQKTYCEVLRTGIGMSKAHYNLELEQTRDSKKKKKQRGAGEPEMSFSVGGQEMASLSKEQQIQTLATAVHTFEMMESVLGRVCEVIDQQMRDTSKPHK